MMIIFLKVLDTMVGWVQHFFGCRGKKDIHKNIGRTKCKFDWKEFSYVVDCKDHFLNDTENGDAIKREVMNKNSSILWYLLCICILLMFYAQNLEIIKIYGTKMNIAWNFRLWKFHNQVNKRLSGDITDDKRFPKETFPNKQHCTVWNSISRKNR